ncbi:MAG TPA: TadE/TadG family type IV pilus assembly protein, partial [Alphaproteobacteria bacterium]|nr:TadE/TadG family type IV pilus assembly protein [Alphaproteobacteria bacterium]
MPRLFPFRFLRRFLRDQRGMTLPMLAFSMVALTAMTGMTIDGARMELVQSKLQFSLDAAGLAAGSTIDTANLNDEVTKYLDANFNGYMGAQITDVTSSVNANNSIITLSATAQLPSTFMDIVGIQNMTVSANSQITRAASGLELVMVLDNTGSMNNDGKLTALKTAATELVTILTGGQGSVPNLWMGLVPFSQAVNIGTGYPSWMDATYDSNLNWGPTAWAGCVDARVTKSPPVQFVPGNASTIDTDITDDPPSVQPFRQYYWPSDTNNCWAYTMTRSRWGTTRTCVGAGTSGATYNVSGGTNGTPSPNAYCPQQVTPMTADATTVTNAINAMTAQGDTHIDLGLAWGWRMLSPRWRGLWGGEMNTNNLPLDYHTPGMNKAVV